MSMTLPTVLPGLTRYPDHGITGDGSIVKYEIGEFMQFFAVRPLALTGCQVLPGDDGYYFDTLGLKKLGQLTRHDIGTRGRYDQGGVDR